MLVHAPLGRLRQGCIIAVVVVVAVAAAVPMNMMKMLLLLLLMMMMMMMMIVIIVVVIVTSTGSVVPRSYLPCEPSQRGQIQELRQPDLVSTQTEALPWS